MFVCLLWSSAAQKKYFRLSFIYANSEQAKKANLFRRNKNSSQTTAHAQNSKKNKNAFIWKREETSSSAHSVHRFVVADVMLLNFI